MPGMGKGGLLVGRGFPAFYGINGAHMLHVWKYGIFAYIWRNFVVHVGKYCIHGAYGVDHQLISHQNLLICLVTCFNQLN